MAKKHNEAVQVKVADGATYTIVRRKNPQPGRPAYYWLGDDGAELELTDEEIHLHGLDQAQPN